MNKQTIDVSIQNDSIQNNLQVEKTIRSALLSKAICNTFGDEQASVILNSCQFIELEPNRLGIDLNGQVLTDIKKEGIRQAIRLIYGNDVQIVTGSYTSNTPLHIVSNENDVAVAHYYQIATGQGNSSNKVTNKTLNYKELKKLLCSFEPVKVKFCNKLNNYNTNQAVLSATASLDEDIKYTRKIAKENLRWFIAGHFEPQVRKTGNMLFRNAIVLDIDNYSGNLKELEDSLNANLGKYEYLAYSTSNHHPNNPKIRVYLPLKKNVLVSEYEAITKGFVDNLTFKEAIDAASYKPNQCMYVSADIEIIDLPTGITLEKYNPWFIENKGELIEPEEYKGKIIPLPVKNKLIKTSSSNNHVATNLSSKDIERFLREYPTEKLSYDEWLQVGMALHNHYQGLSEGYNIWNEWSSNDRRYQEHVNAMKWRSFGDCNNPITFLTIIKKIKDSKNTLWKEKIIAQIQTLTPDFNEECDLIPIIKSIALHCTSSEAEYYFDQIKAYSYLRLPILRNFFTLEKRKLCLEQVQKNKNKVFSLDETLPPVLFGEYLENAKEIKTTIDNLKILIQSYGIILRRNIISRENEILIPNKEYYKETAEESSFASITSLCEKNNLSKSKHLDSYCTEIASANLYNPILDFIQSKSWDQKTRFQEVFDTIITEDGYCKELKELLLRRWSISAIAAISEKKGLFSKGVLVFQGKQSKGKTAWFKEIVPLEIRNYFLEGCHLEPTNKDSVKTAISHWIVEFGELDSTLKKDVARFKAFISSDQNTFRVPYARKDTKFARRTVFCGSVNEKEFLIDHTGNVRFWAIPVTELKLDNLRSIDLQQFWAEMYEIYKSGEKWWLQPEEEEKLELSNKLFVKSCIYEEAFLEKYKIYIPDNEPGIVAYIKKGSQELLLELGWTQPRQSDMNQMSAALLRLGAKKDGHTRKFLVQLR